MTSSMVKVMKVGVMERPDILVLSLKERRMEKADSNGKMEVSMKGTLSMVNSMVMASTTSLS
jgi:hypothetical protein